MATRELGESKGINLMATNPLDRPIDSDDEVDLY